MNDFLYKYCIELGVRRIDLQNEKWFVSKFKLIKIKVYLLLDLQVFPCVDYIKSLLLDTNIKIELYEVFQKRSFRNRYIIAGANGLISLTIPVVGGREQNSLVTEVTIDDTTNWRTKHWRSITSSYSKAPFFEYYAEEVEALIFNPEKRLFNLSFIILTKLCQLLKIKTLIEFTSEYVRQTPFMDFRNKFLPNSFQDEKKNWRPRYSQVFEGRLGFQPNLSILDLIFCEGPNARILLEKSINEE